MSTGSESPEFKALQSAFVAAKAKQGLQQTVTNKPILLSDVYEYFKGNKTPEVSKAISSNLNVRRMFNLVVKNNRVSVIPKAALARDKRDIDERVGVGFSIKFKISKADVNQVYVILSIDPSLEPINGQSYTVMAASEDVFLDFEFLYLLDGKAQVIVNADDQRLTLLKDPDLELHLVVI